MTDPTNVHEPVPQSARLTAREKKWIIYDVGNSAFVLLSTAVIPIYAKSLMPADGNIVSAWGYAQTIASLVIALLMPLLGSIADVQGMKIKFFLGLRHWRGHLLRNGPAPDLAAVPSRLHSGDHRPQRLADVLRFDAHRRHLERAHGQVSSHGYGWSYIGSTVPFIFCIALDLRRPVALRLVHGGLHARLVHHHRHLVGGIHHPAALPATAECTIAPPVTSVGSAVRSTFSELAGTFGKIVKNKPLWMFMIAFFFYIDAVNTVISMSTSLRCRAWHRLHPAGGGTAVTQFVALPLRDSLRSFGRPVRLQSDDHGGGRGIHVHRVLRRVLPEVGRGVLDSGDSGRHVPGRHQALSRSYYGKIIPRITPTSTTASTISSARPPRSSAPSWWPPPRPDRQRLARRAVNRNPADRRAHLPAPAEGPNASVISPINQQQERRSGDKTADPTARAAT